MPIAQLVLKYYIYSAGKHALTNEIPPRNTSPGLKLISLHTWDSDTIHLFHTFFLTCPPLMAVLEREEHLLVSPIFFLVVVSILLLSSIRFFGVNQLLWMSFSLRLISHHLLACVFSLTLKVVFFNCQVISHSYTLSFSSYWYYIKCVCLHLPAQQSEPRSISQITLTMPEKK